MDAMDSGDESDHDIISTQMLEEIHYRSQSHPNVNRREARYKICDRIRQIKLEWKGVLTATRKMGKGLHKVFKNFLKRFSENCHLWENMVQKFTISFQNLETFLK